jgi:ubiquilin
MITVKIKTSSEAAFPIEIEASATILELKTKIKNHFGQESQAAEETQRLIFAGKVLKDAETIESYKIQNDNTYINFDLAFI